MSKSIHCSHSSDEADTDQLRDDHTAPPLVSVFIPSRDSADTIVECVQAISAQDYAGDIEVVIAEADDPVALLELVQSAHPNILVVPNPEKLIVPGLNAAIAAASGQYLVRCDAHNVLPPNYVRIVMETLQDTGAATVGGRQFAIGIKPVQRSIALAMNIFAGSGGAIHRSNRAQEGPADTAFLGAFNRAVLEEVGGFNPYYIRNEDYELNYRFRSNGYTVWYRPDLIVRYYARSSIRRLVVQYFKYGRSKSRLVIDYPRSTKLRHVAAPLLVCSLIVAAVLAVLGLALPLAVLLAVYGVFILGATLDNLVRRRDPAALLLPVALLTMHLSWGIGFLLPARTGRHPEPDSIG